MRNVNENYYEQFSPQERINLAISAMARNDVEEVERLRDTCPTYTYRARDLEYIDRFTAIVLICNIFYGECVYYYNLIKRIEACILLSESVDSQYSGDQIKTLDELDRSREEQIARLKAWYLGAMQFCSQIGINSNDFLKITAVKNICFDIDSYLLSETDVDNKYIEHTIATFLEYWDF